MNTKSLILAASALALAVSCNVMQEESLPLPQKVTFQAVLCDTPPTKTALQSNGAVYWTTGDAINIFYKDNISAKLASDSTATAASAQTSFSGVLEDLVPNGSDYFWAVYPYSGSTTYDGSSVTVTLPSEQYGTPGTFADDLFISMARSMDYTLQFYNLCGGIKFRVANQGIRLVTFAGNNSEILAGQVQATFNSEGKPVVLENLKGATTLRLHSPDDDGFEVGKWYYIVSLPATLSAGYTMTFYNASNEEIAKRVTDTSVSIKRSIWGRLTDADVVAETITASKYLTFTSTGSTTISLTNEGGNAPVLYYSTDAQNWTQWDYSGLTFTEAAPLYLCGNNPEGFGTAYDKYSTFVAEGSSFAVSGDIMSLISMNSDVLTIPSNYCFASLFKNCTGLTAAPSLSATSFVGTSNCYDSMFSGCVGLVSAPELPATELGENCYEEMFRGCTGLTTAPALPATELASGCYWGMFWDCTALASAPELSAVTMASACYAWMFLDCTSLEEMPDLPATTLALGCYRGMFYGCTGLVSSIPSLPASTLSDECYAEMFAYCSNLATAPYLDAPVLAENCYKEMFKGCTSLEYLRCLATDNSATGCTDSWLDSASTSGYFIKDASMTDWPQGTSGIPSGWTVQNSDGSPLMTASKYLTLTSTGSSEVYVDNSGSNAPVLYYSYNLIDWILWEDYSNLPFTANRPIYICGVNPEGFSVNQSSRSTIKFTGDPYAVSGDIMSLIDKDEDVVEIPSDYCFYYLFNSDLNMTSGPSLTATTLRPHCYEGMFSSCFALTVAPELPAMELAENCYAYMFSSCSGLSAAPELPATTLAANCYYDMFYYCTSMKSTPATLPATVLAQNCYYKMFESCWSIASGPSLPATNLADQCYMAMFTDCRGLVEAPVLPADTLATSCYHSMFAGCTSLTVAPDLPAENLTESCYEQMFGSCSGLTTAQAILPSTTLASACYQAMFSGCSSLSTAPELPAPVVATNAYNTMFNQCTSLNFVKCMAYDISASSCVSLWMNNVAATGTFVKTANSQWPTGESGIPEGWKIEYAD